MEKKKKGRLFLIPCPIEEDNANWVGEEIKTVLKDLKHYTVERAKTARRFIKMMQPEVVIQDLIIEEFDKERPDRQMRKFIAPVLAGHDMGIMSEAGNPCIADPGSYLVALAHEMNIEVIPLVGPSSILMALIASGCSGQNFVFHGYLPNRKEMLTPRLKSIELGANKYRQTQIFMETPYRNEFMMNSMFEFMANATKLTVACNIGGTNQSILTKTIAEWKAVDLGPYHKQPCIFIVGN
jgi:16S rRNA (cytidine1402-2'-O)-methyltransferase